MMARKERRFDRWSWVTLGIALALLGGTMITAAVAYRLPWDGWYVDRGAWGRYTPLVYLTSYSAAQSTLQPGDVLIAVEGVPFAQLEAAAARLRPQRPANWQVGETVRYTVLRDGRQVEATATLVPQRWLAPYEPDELLANPILLTFPIFFLICTLVFLLRPRERAAQLLFLFGVAFFNDNLITWTVVSPSLSDLFSPLVYWPRIILGNLLWTSLIAPLLAHLFLIFPVRKRPLRQFPRLAPALLYGACGAVSLLFVLWNIAGHSPPGVIFSIFVVAPCLLLTTMSLLHNCFTISEPVTRLQARWVALGGVAGIVGPPSLWIIAGGLSAGSPTWVGLLYLLLALAMPASFAVAILRHRLWDIEVIIRRTTIYGLLSGTLALIYFSSVIAMQQIYPVQSQISVVLSTLLITALFTPLRNRIQNGIDRRFYRTKYDARRSLASFSAKVRDEVELDSLTRAMLSVVEETVQPERLSLWLKNE